jgi:DNA-directed RNA polymerase subunit RPC12/RpoP
MIIPKFLLQKDNIKFPRCPECGGKVEFKAISGRMREYRKGIMLSIPDDFPIPTCSKCGEEMMIPEVSCELDKILAKNIELMNGK